ncbi:hypothetical protein RSAG8_07247, partial [Rhizoctonia solani AG-8 WAC10335]
MKLKLLVRVNTIHFDRESISISLGSLFAMNWLNTAFDIVLAWHYAVGFFGNFPAVEKSMWFYTIGGFGWAKLAEASFLLCKLW